MKESNESNNTAVKILYPQSSYDFEILPSDVAVSQNPVDIFNDVKITSKVTNKGTMNAYNVQLKYYIDDPQGAFDIATATVDIPAGTTVTNEITWRANKAGQNLPIIVLADPFNTFQEITKENNKAFTYLTVNSSTEPNLTISYKDMTLTPNPVNQGGNVNISALIKNDGFSAASNIKLDFYKGTPGVDGVLLGSSIIQSLNPGESTTVSSDWTNILESGERIIYVKVDPDNQIQEIREDDNDAFTTLKILSLPDLTVSTNSITFAPPAPKEGDIVAVNVTIKNGGEQGVSDVTVRAYEGATLVGSQIISSIPGNSQASTMFTYDTSGKHGARNITVIADPNNGIIEQSEDNNSASRTFGVQDANLWLTEQYISPNGDGAKDSTQFFFRLSSAKTVKIVVVNGKAQIVKTFVGNEFENTMNGHIIWDGLNDAGMIVDDGQYQIKIVDVTNNILGSLLVVVDNNRSPLTDAIGTKYLSNNNLTCMLPDIWENSWQWFPDESGIFFYIGGLNQNTPEYPNGLYTMSPNGEDILRIVPSEWSYGIDPIYDYHFNDYALSQKGEKVAFILNKYNKSSGTSEANQIWVVDRYGANLKLIASKDLTQDPYSGINYLKWSPNGEYIIYMGGNPTELWIMKHDGTGKTQIDPDGGYIDFSTVKWSPDSTKIAYIFDTCIGWNCVPKARISDVSGNRKVIFTMTDYGNHFEWLNSTTIIASVPDDSSWWIEDLWLIDTSEEGNHKMISENPDEFRVSPDNKKIAFIEHDDTTTSVKSSDKAGNTAILYDTSYVPLLGGEINSDNVRNLTWSPDGRKLAFVDDAYGQMDACPSRSPAIKNYIPYSIVVDITNSSRKDIKVGEAACVTYDCMYSYPECYTPGAGRFGSLISFFQDNISILVEDNAYFLINSETGERSNALPIPGGNANSSPLGRYITYYSEPINQNSVCYGRGYQDLWAVSSLLNLTADLRATKEKSAVILKGVAADLNFESYVLEYADTNNPDAWNLISPPSNMPVINDVFTIWIPPYEGTFYVRLSVWDKAGNVAIKRVRMSWGISSSITNLYKSREIFSPNNDGVSDTVELHYNVLEPVHLEFTIYDANNSVIRTMNRDYTSPADDYITWDGRDSSGKFVPDGKYRIMVFD